jgi:glucose uptake protein GlcU
LWYMPGMMWGVQAITMMPSATAILAISKDVSKSGEPSSTAGKIWACKSIKTVLG